MADTIYTELIDMQSFKTLITNFSDLYQDSDEYIPEKKKNTNVWDKKTVLTILNKYYKTKQKTNSITYKYAHGANEGRLFSDGFSLQSLPRQVRHTISQHLYHDIDMVNAHPKILLHYCSLHKIACVRLKDYIDNRDARLASLSAHNMNRDKAKTNILSAMNGKEFPRSNLPEWLDKLYTEFRDILTTVSELKENALFVKNAKRSSSTNYKGKVLNKILCKYENELLQSCVRYCDEHDIAIGALVFDGFMIYKKEYMSDDWLSQLTSNLSEYVEQDQHVRISFSVKPMNEAYDLTPYQDTATNIDYKIFNELLTEEGCAKFILNTIKEKIFYHKANDKIYLYNDKTLLYEDTELLDLMPIITPSIQSIFDSHIEDLKSDPDKKSDYAEAKNRQKYYKSERGQKAILHIMIRHCEKKDAFIDKHFNRIPYLFPIANNKVVDFRYNKVRDRLPSDYFSKTTDNIHEEKVNFTPIYDYVGSLLKTTDQVFIDNMLTVLAYFLTGYNHLRRFFIFTGDGSNGKSALLSLFDSIIGDFGRSANAKVFIKSKSEAVHNAEMFTLMEGTRLATISEADSTSSFNEAMIKKITGNDGRFSLRKPGGEEQHNCIVDPKLLALLNTVPGFQDGALADRMCIFPFINKFVASESKLKEILSLKDNLFSVLCDYAKRFCDNDMKYNPCPQVVNYTKSVVLDKDSVAEFISEEFEITGDNNHCIDRKEMFQFYSSYCKTNEIKSVSKTILFQKLVSDHKLVLKTVRGVRKFAGLRSIQFTSDEPDSDVKTPSLLSGNPLRQSKPNI